MELKHLLLVGLLMAMVSFSDQQQIVDAIGIRKCPPGKAFLILINHGVWR